MGDTDDELKALFITRYRQQVGGLVLFEKSVLSTIFRARWTGTVLLSPTCAYTETVTTNYKNRQMARNILIIFTFTLTTFNLYGQCSIGFTQANALCFGDCNGSITAIPTGSAPFSFAWTTGDTTQTVTDLCAGTYTLTMTDNLGCIAIGSVTINEPPQLVGSVTILSSPSAPLACDAELTYSVTGGISPYTLQWYDCANDSVIRWSLMPPPPWYFCPGEWGIIIIDANGCSDTSCVTVIDPPTTTQENSSQNGLSYQIIDRVIIFSKPINALIIFDAFGHLVYITSNETTTQVTLPDISSGLYIIRASTINKLQLTGKLIIQRE